MHRLQVVHSAKTTQPPGDARRLVGERYTEAKSDAQPATDSAVGQPVNAV